MKKRTPLFLCIAGLTANMLSAQPVRLQTPQVGDAALSFQYWKAKKDHVTQFALPVTYIYPYSDKLRLYAKTYPAFTDLNMGSSYHLGGLSDIKLGGHYLTLNDEVLITFGLNLPTGKSALASDEIPVASVISLPAFEMQVPSLGQGLDLQLGLNTAWEWGDFIVGYGISYILKGPFSVFKDADQKYNPGNEVTITWGIQREVVWLHREMHITADLLYTGYSPDKMDSEVIFSSGDRLILQMMSQFRERDWDLALLIRERIKAPNSYSGDIRVPTETKNANGNQFQLTAYGFHPYRQDMRLKTLIDLKLFANNDYDVGGAILFGFGGGAEKQLAPQMTANGECRFYLGRIKQSAKNAFALGFKIMGGIRYEF
jgi:hypothetical protein